MSTDETEPKPARKFVFQAKPSVLSSVADKIWDKSKIEFSSEVKKPIVLEKKSLDNVLSKYSKQKQEEEVAGDTQPTFIFGSKIAERVAFKPSSSADNSQSDTNGKPDSHSTEKPKTCLAEQGALSAESRADKLRADSEHLSAEVAKEAEKQKATTHVVKTTTGEEEDINIHQFSCKIYSFDHDKKAWAEKGNCLLRINQKSADQNGEITHRIVARTLGTMKVIINSQVYADMLIEKVDEKRLKISAFAPDNQERPQVFLIASSFSKTEGPSAQLLSALMEVRQCAKSLAANATRNALGYLTLVPGAERKRKASDVDEEGMESSLKKEKEDTSGRLVDDFERQREDDEDSRSGREEQSDAGEELARVKRNEKEAEEKEQLQGEEKPAAAIETS